MAEIQKRVLVVDDMENWRDLLVELLANEFVVDCTGDYQHALTLLDEQKPPYHVLVTDIRLEDRDETNKDGIRLVERVGRMGEYIKSVVVTGYPSYTDAVKVTRFQAYDYILKNPFDGDEFVDKVRTAAQAAERARNAFVIMPYNGGYDGVYEKINETVKNKGIECWRADDSFKPGIVIDEIVDGIRGAGVVIADISERNPNVYFETGIAHAMQKNVILLTHEKQAVSRLFAAQRYIHYENSFNGIASFQTALEKSIDEVKNQVCEPPFKKSTAEIDPDLCLVLTPVNAQGQGNYTSLIKPVVRKEGLKCASIMEDYYPGGVLQEIYDQLTRAQLVIVDMTGKDIDVFYLAGLASGLGKKVILLASSEAEIPFDLRGVSAVIYSSSMDKKGKTGAVEKMKQMIRQLLNRIPPATSRISPDVVILTILPEEYQAVCQQVSHLELPPNLGSDVNLYAWRMGKVRCDLHGSDYYFVVGLTGRAGPSFAALAIFDAIQRWNPRYVILSGIAGGLGANTHKGDVVISEIIYGYEYGKIDDVMQRRSQWTYSPDDALYVGICAYAKKSTWKNRINLTPPEACEPQVIIGEVASGDKVVDVLDTVHFRDVLERYPKLKAVEMEGAGLGPAIRQANSAGKPVGFIMVRGISDLPRSINDGDSTVSSLVRDQWKAFASQAAAAFTLGYIEEGLPVKPRNIKE